MTEKPETRYKIIPVLEGHWLATVDAGTSKMLCPFHDESNPSAWHTDYYFKCFACGVQGDAVGLLVRQEGMSFADAYKRAEELAGKPDEPVREQPARRSRMAGSTRDYRGHSRYGASRRGR